MTALTAPDTIVFAAALLLMPAIGLVEALGLGAAGMDADLGFGMDGRPPGWLGIAGKSKADA